MSVKALTQGIEMVATTVGKALIPPWLKGYQMWMLSMSLTVGFLFVAFLWSVGLFAAIGFPGFARADQQDEILQELREQKIERLETQILQFQRDFCAQPPGSRPRTFYLAERNERLNEYQALTGETYSGLPECGEL